MHVRNMSRINFVVFISYCAEFWTLNDPKQERNAKDSSVFIVRLYNEF